MKPPIDSNTPNAPENPQTAVRGHPSTPFSQLVIIEGINNDDARFYQQADTDRIESVERMTSSANDTAQATPTKRP